MSGSTDTSERQLFTSESVGEGHPDKLADQISDAVLDACLTSDPYSHVGCETYVTTGLVLIGGEITTHAYIDIHKLVRKVVQEVGYDRSSYGLNYSSMAILNAIDPQSEDINSAVRRGERGTKDDAAAHAVIGAGDQGIMFGYACDETEHYMPAAITIAHGLVRRVSELRRKETLEWLGPDAKSQVTIEYAGTRPVRVDTVVVSQQHAESVTEAELREFLTTEVIRPVIGDSGIAFDGKTKYIVNPSGRFVAGGPQADAGLTGRKVIIDTYGGSARHGGGAFSGKDPSKVDRSAAYIARKAAKTVVAAELAGRCEIQLSYAIGMPEPISIALFTHGTARAPEAEIVAALRKVFDFTPRGIIDELDLLRPIYRPTACYGHFGRPEFSWEALDKVDALRNAL